MATFGYFVNCDERGEFRADVRAQDDRTLHEVVSDEDGEIWEIDCGFMADPHDVSGLYDMLVENGVLCADDELLPSPEAESMWEAESEFCDISIKLRISTQNLGDVNTRADNECYARAVKDALECKYPGANITVSLTDELSDACLVSDDPEGDIAENVNIIAQEVWAGANYIETHGLDDDALAVSIGCDQATKQTAKM